MSDTPDKPGEVNTDPKKVASDTPSAKTYSEDEFNKATAAIRREEEKKASDYKKKAAEFDALQAKQKEKEQAELSELEKLKSQINDLTPFKTKSEEYEQTISEILEAELLEIPQENKSFVDALPSMSPLQKLKWLRANADKLYNGKVHTAAPAGGRTATDKPDEALVKATAIVDKYNGHLKGEAREKLIKMNVESLRRA